MKCAKCKKEVSLVCSCGYCVECQAIEHELGSRCRTITEYNIELLERLRKK